jgi:hypothetical protein
MHFRDIEWVVNFKFLNYLLGLHVDNATKDADDACSPEIDVLARGGDADQPSQNTITQLMHIIMILNLPL